MYTQYCYLRWPHCPLYSHEWFYNWRLYLVAHPNPPLWQLPICFLYIWAWFYLFACFFFFYMPHISEIIWYLSFSVWLILVSIMPSGSIYFITNCKILFFGWLVFHCLFIHRCLLSLFLDLQFSSVQSLSRVRLCDPMSHSMPSLGSPK